MVNHNDLGMLQHLVDIQIDRGGLAQIHQIGETHRWQMLAVHSRLQLRIRIGQQRQRGIRRAQNHDLAGRLLHAGNKGFIIDKATGLNGKQMHQIAPTDRAFNSAVMALSSRS